MTPEQKAKAYDKALEIARKELQTCGSTDCDAARQIYRFFPELKESEDEKIRKELIDIVKKSPITFAFEDKNKVLAWLEKQGEPTDINPSEFDLRLNKLLKQFESLPKEELANSLSFYLNVVQNDGTYKPDEGQGEQKPRYSIGDVLCDKSCTTLNKDTQPNFEIIDIRDGMYICDKGSFPISQQDEYELVAKKIEPKFKVGDWILYSGDYYEGVRYITKINENGYYIERNGLPHGIIPFNHERCMRLWTIDDAKDGDVLEFGDHGRLVVGIVSYINKTTGKVDVNCLLENNCFKVGNYYNLDTINPHPATKEQRETLLKAMADAGYTFDFEKKELKKIGQNISMNLVWQQAIKHRKENKL